jgi:hypothetical protein
MSFVLCDPGLVMPPGSSEVETARMFWTRLIEWSNDRRVKLGVESFQILLDFFAARGWPDFVEPACPSELRMSARTALNRVLSSVREPVHSAAQIPVLTPRYLRDADAECALAIDLSATWAEELLALATVEAHWGAVTREVAIDPPPPSVVSLIAEPRQALPREIDRNVSEFLKEKRLTIVGALPDERFVRVLCRTFHLAEEQIRWLGSEPGREPQLEGLKALAGDRDIVCCILGAPGQLGLGHAGSEKAIRLATNRGAETIIVDRPNRLLASLRDRFGS